MGLIGFSKLSCTNCGQRFYSRVATASEKTPTTTEPMGSSQTEKEEEATSFEMLIRKIEAAERDSGLKTETPKKQAAPEPAKEEAIPGEESNEDGHSEGPLVGHRHLEKNEERGEFAESEVKKDLGSESPAIELPFSSLELEEEPVKENEKENLSKKASEALEIRKTPSRESDRSDSEEMAEEVLAQTAQDQEALSSTPKDSTEEEVRSRSVEEVSEEPSNEIDLDVEFASAKRKKPTPESLNNYDLLSLLPKKRKKE